MDLQGSEHSSDYLFVNRSHQPLTRGGVAYILKKYCDQVRQIHPEQMPDRFSPHCLRHSKAMHLLQAGNNLIYIRDILGHVDVSTTEIYAKADPEMKRHALEKAYQEITPSLPDWTADLKILSWLQTYKKRRNSDVKY